MNEAYSIRRFASEDAAEVLNIIHRALREVCSRSYPADIIAEVCDRFSIEPDSAKMQRKKWSGQQDSNLRPHAPKARALPD